MTAQTVELAGKRFVIVEERQFLKLVRKAEKAARMSRQDWGDVAESKRRLAEPDRCTIQLTGAASLVEQPQNPEEP